MRAFDAHAITQCGVPGVLLMENAGRGATDVLVRELYDGDVRRGAADHRVRRGQQRRRRPRHRAPPARARRLAGGLPRRRRRAGGRRRAGELRGVARHRRRGPVAAAGRPSRHAERGARARRDRRRRALRHGPRPPHRGLAGRRRARDERVVRAEVRGRPAVGPRRRHGRRARRRGRGEGHGDVRALQARPPHAQRREPRGARARRRHRRPARPSWRTSAAPRSGWSPRTSTS